MARFGMVDLVRVFEEYFCASIKLSQSLQATFS